LKRGYAVPIVLLAIAVVVGVFAWRDRDSVTDSERSARADRIFPAFRRADVTRIEIGALVLERAAGAEASVDPWRITAPRAEVADVPAVERLLRELDQATRLRKVEDASGFDPPRVRGKLHMGPIGASFALGGDARVPEGAGYLRVDGEGTFVVAKSVVDALLLSPDAYRDRAVVPFGWTSAARLVVGDLALSRVNDVDFRIESSGLRASRPRMEKVWSALAEVRAEAFLSDEAADRALSQPLRVSMTSIDGKREMELALGGECPGHPTSVVVVRSKPAPRISACAPKGALEGMRTSADALADTRLFSSHDDEVAELRIVASPSGERIEIARKESAWHQRAPVDRDLAGDDADAAGALALAVTRTEGSAPKKDDGAPFVPRARVTVVKGGGRGEEIIEVGESEVKRLADGARLAITPDVRRKLSPRAVALRPLTAVHRPPVQALASTALRTDCDGVAQELVQTETGWTMTAPARRPADIAASYELAEAALRVKALAWIADADDGSFGFARVRCSLAVTVRHDGGSRNVDLAFGDEAEGGVYARAGGAVFVAPKPLRAAAARWLADRSALRVYVHAASRVAMNGRDVGRSEKRDDALAALAPDLAVHLGKPEKGEGFDRPTLTLDVDYDADAGLPKTRMSVGALRGDVYFARAEGVDATFTLPRAQVEALLALLR
jgi:hypothetical protein